MSDLRYFRGASERTDAPVQWRIQGVNNDANLDVESQQVIARLDNSSVCGYRVPPNSKTGTDSPCGIPANSNTFSLNVEKAILPKNQINSKCGI
ncbi:hypothetical protein RUM44_008096 [Polyplax serrata]|uniref:Uncharacterized protein n=1 Tax=Polyplax serrata TaxID=468196 RepID=A0ABR1B967_POLSC